MSVELIGVLIAVVAVGATLAGLMLSGQRAIRAELAEQRKEFSAELRERMAHLAGLPAYHPGPDGSADQAGECKTQTAQYPHP